LPFNDKFFRILQGKYPSKFAGTEQISRSDLMKNAARRIGGATNLHRVPFAPAPKVRGKEGRDVNEIKMIRSTCGVRRASNGCFMKFKSYKFRDDELPRRVRNKLRGSERVPT